MFSGIFKNLGMDLGTANTIIYAYDKGYIVNEPSVIAFKNGSNRGYKILCIGLEAKRMLGKTGREIKVIRPLADGVIADFVAGEALVKSFIRRANIPSFLLNRMVIGVPTGITSVERKRLWTALWQPERAKCISFTNPWQRPSEWGWMCWARMPI